METLTLNNGTKIPKLGQGTWHMGDASGNSGAEIATLRRGIELGMTLIDTAEMYGSGLSEQLVGQAIAPLSRQDLYVVSKVYPQNAGGSLLEKSLDQSLKNLNTEYLDLYLLHWRGHIPLTETVEAMEEQVAKGKIKAWGVSNFDTRDMKELLAIPEGKNCQVNQVLYHFGSRGVEFDLLPYLQGENIPLMAYCPLAQAGALKRSLVEHPQMIGLAEKHNTTVLTLLLAFAIGQEAVFAIPKASQVVHVEENAKAAEIKLSPEDWALLEEISPKPKKKVPLDML